jgi:hypothetical protein
MIADVVGLQLAVHQEKFPWGTRYGPLTTQEREDGTSAHNPDRSQLTPEMIQIWEQRARKSQHPYLRHRYAEQVWDLKKLVTGERAAVEFAHLAIDGLIARQCFVNPALASSGPSLDGIRPFCCRSSCHAACRPL